MLAAAVAHRCVKSSTARSVTSTRLAELEAKREAIVPAKLEDRELVIIAPGGGTVQQAEEETQDAGR
eukprot:scaffold564_cov248-Pinguiococcus_pyrenoidosus.AAC.12